MSVSSKLNAKFFDSELRAEMAMESRIIQQARQFLQRERQHLRQNQCLLRQRQQSAKYLQVSGLTVCSLIEKDSGNSLCFNCNVNDTKPPSFSFSILF